ncbi:MAG: hypothetical protein U1E76_18545 [Planctomycetota bacterium]
MPEEVDPGADKLRAELSELRKRLEIAERSLQIVASAFLPPADQSRAKPLRPGQADDMAQVARDLAAFARRIEKSVIELSATFRGALSAKGALLPEMGVDMRGLVETLVAQGGQSARERLSQYLEAISRWMVASLVGYKHAASDWSQQWLGRMGPAAIEAEIRVSAVKRALGLGYVDLWRTFKRKADELDAELIQDEIDEAASRYAREFVDKKAN